MKIQMLVFLCLFILFIQTSVFAQLLYNNGVNISLKSGILVYVDGSIQNQTGQFDVDNTSSASELIITCDDYYETQNLWDDTKSGKELPFGIYMYVLKLNNKDNYKEKICSFIN